MIDAATVLSYALCVANGAENRVPFARQGASTSETIENVIIEDVFLTFRYVI